MSEIIIIAAVAQNNVIGKDNQIPWHIPADFLHFKNLTMGHPVLMGDRTFESLPGGALPGRANIVLTKDPSFSASGVIIKNSFESAFEYCQNELDDPEINNSKIYIIGGATIYRLGLEFADKLELTRIFKDYNGEVKFPEINFDEWNLEKETQEIFVDKNGEKIEYSFQTWNRKK
ncbi:MAG: dihydrofolate reductase [Patescibacteria group bacterium]